MVPRPGMGPTMRTEAALRARARSSARLTTWLTFTPGRRLELVRGDDRARAHLDDAAVDLEVLELAAQGLGVVLELLARAAQLLDGRRLQEPDRRQLEGLRAALAEVERLLPGQPLLHQPAARPRRLDDDRQRRLDLGLRLDAGRSGAAVTGSRRGSHGLRPRAGAAASPGAPSRARATRRTRPG